MPKHIRHGFLVGIVFVAALTAGCLFGAGPITSLELVVDKSSLLAGETAIVTAVGKTEKGKVVTFQPQWEIVSGNGSLEPDGSQAVFYASNWDHKGTVKLQVTYGKLQAETEIETLGLLGEIEDPFPKPESAFDLMPERTEPQIISTNDLAFFSNVVALKSKRDGHIFTGRARFVWDGKIMIADSPAPDSWVNALHYTEIPEIPKLSHRVHFERIGIEVLDRGTNYSRSVAHRTGTTKEHATELMWSVTSETTASARWGWGDIQTKLTAEIKSTTKQSVRIEEETTVTKSWSFQHPNDHDVYLYTSWNRVDTFYLSDSKGVPLEESEIFQGWGFSSNPVEIRGSGVVQRTWGFDYE